MKRSHKLLIIVCSPFALLILVCIWMAQILLFTPLLIFAKLFLPERVFSYNETPPVFTNYQVTEFVFDRLRDVSKLYGCNTRNVKYRWDTFLGAITSIRQTNPAPLTALDFGAGCLRDTYELIRLGFQVTACDLNEARMLEGSKAYDWTTVGNPPIIRSGDIVNIDSDAKYDVITAYDVIEHLQHPENILQVLRERLKMDGILLVSVPNRLSQFEKSFQKHYEEDKRRGIVDMSGVPHIQFRTPQEWKVFFQAQGFEIITHDMTLGVLVNDLWAGFYGVRVRTFVEPVLLGLKKAIGLKYKLASLESLFYPAWLMEIIDRIDVKLKPYLHNRWGWNLFVLKKASLIHAGGIQ